MSNQPRMTRCLGTLLCLLLVTGPVRGQGSEPDSAADLVKVKRIALSIPLGSPVQLQMKDKSKLTGRIGQVENTGFDLQTIDNGNIVSKKIAFEQIRKLSAGAPSGKLKAAAAPLFRIMALLGTVGAVTAAIRK